jgi:DNA-binding transcriptional MerR regulator
MLRSLHRRFQRILPQRLGIGFFALVALTLLVVLPIAGQSLQPLLSPEAAAQQAEQLSPEEITKLEIDEVTRDRLRFDPAWQPMHRAIQQDIMILKWGDGRLQHPVWQQYGVKSYPLLDYYAHSADQTREIYGIVGIRSLGKPYTTLWLEHQLQRGSQLNFYQLQEDPNLLTNDYNENYDSNSWKREFGLDDPATRDRLLQIARAHLKPATDPDYYNQFNLAFINTMLGDNLQPPAQPAPPNPGLDPALAAWNQLAALPQVTPAQSQQALQLYRSLNPTTQQYLLVQRLGNTRAGRAAAIDLALLRQLATDANEPDRVWAIAELDPEGSRMLQQMINGTDLTQLNPLTRLVSYESDFWDQRLEGAKSTHAYYLLVNMAQKYPQSRFIRAAREYGNLTGRSYFGGDRRLRTGIDRLTRQTVADRAHGWQNWLSQYPDHPGADDATYFVARSLQDQNQVMSAMALWIALMTQPLGDGDATYLAYPHIRTMLDVGLTTEQIQTLVQKYQNQSIAPLFRYALAVRQARSQHYTEALKTSEGIDLSQLSPTILGSYYHKVLWYGEGDRLSQVQQRMQAMLTEQRQRWQHLQQLQTENTPASRYDLASDWAGAGGWKNGYLAVWEGHRTSLLPTGAWEDDHCKVFWVCNSDLRDQTAMRSSYQQASRNAIAVNLYQSLLSDPQTPASLREKTLYMTASTLLWQWENYPLGETVRIHPPAGILATEPIPHLGNTDDYDQWQVGYNQIQHDYETSLDQTIAKLKQEFPQSIYIDDLLFSRFAIGGDRPYLQQIVAQYPNGDRAAEARFLLAHPKEN